MSSLKLGDFDRDSRPDDWHAYLRAYHESPMRADAFRGDPNGVWARPRALTGTSVRQLQVTLRELGFLPRGLLDGIFGYRTLAAVRLGQEYLRTVGGKPELGAPDGIVGPNTRRALDQARSAGLRCRWTLSNERQDPPWLELLRLARDRYRDDYRRLLPELLDQPSDTLPSERWTVEAAPVHIIGIRRGAWAASLDSAGKRLNNDVFVVIVNGRVMWFFGSTDPNPGMSSHADGIPFLCKGQHHYRFGFHRLADNGAKCYRALRPAGQGVRVVRDTDGDRKLSAPDRLDPAPNPTINLHWSGRGTSNWSAGCQVIGGAVYCNDADQTIDCWPHAAIGYAGLGGGRGRGAYDLMMSWISACAEDIRTSGTLNYTLLEEEDLRDLAPTLHRQCLASFRQAAGTVALHDRSLRNLIEARAPHLLA